MPREIEVGRKCRIRVDPFVEMHAGIAILEALEPLVEVKRVTVIP